MKDGGNRNMASDEVLCRIVNKFCSRVDGVSSLHINDRPLQLQHLCIENGKLHIMV